MSKSVAVLLVTLLSFPGLAQTQHQKDALSELSSEQIQCAAYFVVSPQCMWNSDAKALGDDYKKAAEVMSQQGFSWGKKTGLLDAALSARMMLATFNFAGEIRRFLQGPCTEPGYATTGDFEGTGSLAGRAR